MTLMFSGGSIVIIWQALWGIGGLGSATGWCHLLDILAEIKVHMRIGRGLLYLLHFLTFCRISASIRPFLDTNPPDLTRSPFWGIPSDMGQ